MERYFILDKFNTWYDWRLILTAKNIAFAEPKTNLVELDGMSGSLDLSEVLTGEITFENRVITASFWTNNGTYQEREKLLRDVTVAIHGKKIKVVEPDDPDHYFLGRAKITAKNNTIPYLVFTIEINCEPWRYAVSEANRTVEVRNENIPTYVIIRNTGVKTLIPEITVNGLVTIKYNDITTTLTYGTYKIPDIKLKQGVNSIEVSGDGSVTFKYREADL